MAGTRYDVEAELRLKNTDKAKADVKGVANGISELANRLRGVQSPAGGMVRSLLGIGAAYVGVSAITHAFTSASKGAFAFQAELEKTKIGLASVLSATQGYSFAEGMKEGSKVFRDLSDDAIKSTATTKELFDIYQSLVGPISAAGKSLSVVRSITNDTVSAASALGVDFAQASRDINMMVTGRAGAEVMLFRKLNSTGAIKESAKQFNALTQTARIDKIAAALGKFAPAAEAYGKSWAGVTSSFTDIVQQLSAAAYGPAFEAIKKFVGGINDRLLAHREAITAYMTRIGSVLGRVLDKTFARATSGVDYVINHWGEINARISDTVEKIKAMVPKLERAAKAFAVLEIGKSVAPGALRVAGAVAGGGEKAGIALGKAVAGSGLVTAIKGAYTEALSIMNPATPLFAVPAAAEAGGAGTAAAAAGSGAAAGIGTAGLIGAGVALGALVAVAAAASDQLAPLKAILEATLMPLGTELWGLAKSIGTALLPVFKIIGSVMLAVAVPAFTVGISVLRVLVGALTAVFDWFGKITNHLYDKLKPTIDSVFLAFKKLAEMLGGFVSSIFGHGPAAVPRQVQQGLPLQDGRLLVENKPAFRMGGEQFSMFPDQDSKRKTPSVVNDFRGSKIEVHQQFKEADPDRVLIQMVDSLNREAEMKTRSSYAPALAGA